MAEKSEKNILWFNEIGMEDVPLIEEKNGSLGRTHVSASIYRGRMF